MNQFLSLWIISIFSFSLLTTECLASEKARTLFDQGQYQQALDELQSSGMKSAEDFYNAANCYFKLNKYGQALAFYEKARSLKDDGDIVFNLNLSKEALEKTGSLTKDQSFWLGTLVPFSKTVSSSVIFLFFSILSVSLSFYLLRAKKAGFKIKSLIRSPVFWGVHLGWLCLTLVCATVLIAHQTPLVVITADSAVSRSGPGDSFTELFRLTAGTKAESTGEQREGWRQIRFSFGNVGWLQEKDILPL